MPRDTDPVTLLLNDQRSAQDRVRDLLPLVYDQLRAGAQKAMQAERRNHTLSATALVHEAYLKLCGPRDIPWQNRAHFYTAAAQAMRQVLLDHAKARLALKRGGSAAGGGGGQGGMEGEPVGETGDSTLNARRAAVELASLPDPASDEQSAGFLILDRAIVRLEGVDPEAAAVVRLRYFAGLSIEQTAAAMGVSAPTVKRSWAFARGWLKEAIESGRV